MKELMPELSIKAIALDNDNHLPIVILQEKRSGRTLPVKIGPFEASAIIVEMEEVHPPRPLTHDLLADFFRKHGYSMDYLHIYAFLEDSYLAKVHYRRRMRKYSMEVRPSDGMALALRLGAPIFMEPALLDQGPAPGTRWNGMISDEDQILYLEPNRTKPRMM